MSWYWTAIFKELRIQMPSRRYGASDVQDYFVSSRIVCLEFPDDFPLPPAKNGRT